MGENEPVFKRFEQLRHPVVARNRATVPGGTGVSATGRFPWVA